MSTKHNLLSFTTAFVVLAVMALILINNPKLIDQLLGLSSPPHLSDKELILNFHQHRMEFERLQKMIGDDEGLSRLNAENVQLETVESSPVGEARISEYRALLRKIGVRGGISVSTDRKTIEITSTHRGMATHNSQKGYLYIGGPVMGELFSDLDRFSQTETGSGVRHIEGNWYIYFEGY